MALNILNIIIIKFAPKKKKKNIGTQPDIYIYIYIYK